MKEPRAQVDRDDPRNVWVFIDCVHFGVALAVVEHAQANPPVGYRWERMVLARVTKSGARSRASVKWRHINTSEPLLSPSEIKAHKAVVALAQIAAG